MAAAPFSCRNTSVEMATCSAIAETLEKVWLTGSQSKCSRAEKELEAKQNQNTISKTGGIPLTRPALRRM